MESTFVKLILILFAFGRSTNAGFTAIETWVVIDVHSEVNCGEQHDVGATFVIQGGGFTLKGSYHIDLYVDDVLQRGQIFEQVAGQTEYEVTFIDIGFGHAGETQLRVTVRGEELDQDGNPIAEKFTITEATKDVYVNCISCVITEDGTQANIISEIKFQSPDELAAGSGIVPGPLAGIDVFSQTLKYRLINPTDKEATVVITCIFTDRFGTRHEKSASVKIPPRCSSGMFQKHFEVKLPSKGPNQRVEMLSTINANFDHGVLRRQHGSRANYKDFKAAPMFK